MLDRHQIENRINAVADYHGTQHLPTVIAASTKRENLGSDPYWLTARACMTPTEYMAFGKDGEPWRFLKGKADVAQRCIDAARRAVEDACKRMELKCNWSKIGQHNNTILDAG